MYRYNVSTSVNAGDTMLNFIYYSKDVPDHGEYLILKKKMRAVVLKCQHAPGLAGAPELPVKTHRWARPQVSDLVGLWWGPSMCLSKRCPGDSDAAVWDHTVRTTVLEPADKSQFLSLS